MPKHAAPSAYKEDFRNILTQQSPQQVMATVKVVAVLIFLVVFFVCFVVRA